MSEAAILYRLQQIDLALTDLQQRLHTQTQLGETTELQQARNAVQATKKQASVWRTRLKEAELALESLVSKISQGEQRLYSGKVRNPKELRNLQRELTSLKQRRSAKEEEVLGAMVQVEDLARSQEEAHRHLRAVESAWRESQASLTAEQESLQKQLSELSKERREVAATVSANALRMYDYLRQRKAGRAVALLAEGVCQGCRVSVSSNKKREVQLQDSIVTCGNCGRILCSKDPQP